MKFGIFYELQLPRPGAPTTSASWCRTRWRRSSSPTGSASTTPGRSSTTSSRSTRTARPPRCSSPPPPRARKRIRLGHGIRQVIPNYNHPARTAEAIAMLDLVSNGRAELGIGEGATRLELGGFDIPAKEKRAMSLEAAEQIANMMVMEPYPGFEGRSFKMPCRNVVPKPVQKPHPPMWMACTNRDTIKIAASHGLGALAFSFLDEAEARTWSEIYYDIIKSDACVPLGHSVNANIAMVSAFSLHRRPRRGGPPRPGRLRVLPLCHHRARHQRHGARPLAAVGGVPGEARRAARWLRPTRAPKASPAPSKPRPASARRPTLPQHVRCLRGRRRRPDHLAAAGRPQRPRRHLRLARAVRPRGAAASSRPRPRSARPQGRGAGALHRQGAGAQEGMAPLADADIPVVRASVAKPAVNQSAA